MCGRFCVGIVRERGVLRADGALMGGERKAYPKAGVGWSHCSLLTDRSWERLSCTQGLYRNFSC